MKSRLIPLASELEKQYIHALSRDSVVSAYKEWMKLTKTERQCLSHFLKKGDSILDLGCGVGRIPKIFGKKMEKYLGIDCSAEMIKTAKDLNPQFEFIQEDFLEMHFEKSSFSAVLLMNNVIDMLNPIERRQQAFELAKSLLSSAGVMIFSSHLLHNHQESGYFEEEYHGVKVNTYRSTFIQLCKEVESHGLKVEWAARDYRKQSQFADWAYVVAST